MLLPARAPCPDKKKRVRTRIASRLSLVEGVDTLDALSSAGFAVKTKSSNANYGQTQSSYEL